MSRIGKKPVDVTAGVTVTLGKDNIVTVKGPMGELKQAIDRDITVEIKDNTVLFTRPTDQIRHRAMHGLYRSLISNMVKGVTEGFKKELELVGVCTINTAMRPLMWLRVRAPRRLREWSLRASLHPTH